MSRGFGSLQFNVLNALDRLASTDRYDAQRVSGQLIDASRIRWVRARWRWYTIDLLDLVESGGRRSERVSLHRAVRSLQRARRLQVEETCPYGHVFAPYENEYGEYEGGLYLPRLSIVDPRWPSRQGRSLWFRLPPPRRLEQVPEDDQIAQLDAIDYYQPEAFRDFTEARDPLQAWQTPVGRYIRWLFCGPEPPKPWRDWELVEAESWPPEKPAMDR